MPGTSTSAAIARPNWTRLQLPCWRRPWTSSSSHWTRTGAAAMTTRPIAFTLTDSGQSYALNPGAKRPRLHKTDTADAPLVIEGPDEEVVRFVAGRHFVPGSLPRLEIIKGTAQDLANLRRAFR